MKTLLLFGIAMIVGILALGFFHEQVHVQIFKSYGIDSHVEYFSNFPNFITVPEGNYSLCNGYCELAQNETDIVGYHLIAIYFLLALGLFFIIGELISIQEKMQKNINPDLGKLNIEDKK